LLVLTEHALEVQLEKIMHMMRNASAGKIRRDMTKAKEFPINTAYKGKKK
jgi:hypothetical protein